MVITLQNKLTELKMTLFDRGLLLQVPVFLYIFFSFQKAVSSVGVPDN